MNIYRAGSNHQPGSGSLPESQAQGFRLGVRVILALLAVCLALASCTGSFDPLPWLQPGTATPIGVRSATPIGVRSATPSSTSAGQSTLTPRPAQSSTPDATIQSATPNGVRSVTPAQLTPDNKTPMGKSQTLLIWVPPQFDPSNGTPGSDKLKARLAAFENENPGLKVQVRVKGASGSGGLLESLSAASAAAPGTLPSLIATSRSDLETAALKGLVFPLDGMSRLVDDADWYSYSRQLALIQGTAFGLPFAGDSLLMLYRPAKLPTPPTDWPGLIKAALPASFPAADNQSLLTLLLYLSAGGQVKDSQGRPTLQAEPLTQVLRLYADGQKAGIFPNWLAQYQTDGQAWQAYREQRTQLLITWSSRYLIDLPADTSAVPIPSLGGQSLTLATGWLWALVDPSADRRSAAVRLAEYLVNSDFLAQWSAATGYLPTRPSSLTGWSNQSLRALLSPVLLSSQVRPANDLLLGLGPILQEATLQIIKQQGDPAQTAQAAAERLSVPPSK